MGKDVIEFEKEFVEYIGVKYVILVGNGIDVLVVVFMVCGIGKGDEVIIIFFIFFFIVESILVVGVIFVFVDVEVDIYNIDVIKIEEKIIKKIKVIMLVYIFG